MDYAAVRCTSQDYGITQVVTEAVNGEGLPYLINNGYLMFRKMFLNSKEPITSLHKPSKWSLVIKVFIYFQYQKCIVDFDSIK